MHVFPNVIHFLLTPSWTNLNLHISNLLTKLNIFQMAGAPMPESGKIGESSKSKGMSDEEIEAQLAKLRG